ncbi:amino acid adenylation domain-containing protein [Nocardia panacis]|uniref:Amino acid adenylation domain-containing protein n=1 Tax=Nocardia panacis TaxID=2340916 RepID=A0A3A4KAF1_9NOCA|nr:non-ribosomal peptide synthetase [Nocardia panacis]RJO72048.1 amino acid adenylation domain-containing protein [Nocardia panacis]
MSQTTRPEIEDVLALSPLQEGLFSLARLAGADDLYNMQFVLEVAGPVDTALLRRSVETILARHANLRAAFWDRDLPKPVQIVPAAVELPWFETTADSAEFEAIVASEARFGFDLSRGPALRVVLVRLCESDTAARRMIVTAHHILMDGWSLGVFFRELFAVYEAGGSAAALPDPRPYRDYIGWLASRDNTAALGDWVDYLGEAEPLILADRAEGAINTAVPDIHTHTVGVAETERLQRWARANGLTMNTVVQFAWAVVLSRLTDRRDIVFGTTVSGRPDELAGVETMIGLFINTVPVRIPLAEFDGEPIAQACARLQRTSARMRDIGYLSLSAIQRAAGRGNLFDTLFVYENAPVADVLQEITTADGTSFRPTASESLTHYPLAVVSYLLNGELAVVVEAVTAALGELSAADLGDRLVAVLRQLPESGAVDQESLDVLLPDERPRLPASVASDVAGVTVAELFARQAAATPDACALTTEDETFSYRELSDAALRVAAGLRACGIGAEDTVALALPRSARSVVAILGVLSAGAAYVPIDLSLPDARIASILRQSNPRIILTDGDFEAAGAVPVASVSEIGKAATLSAPIHVAPDSCAYLIFTSGSTGEPKGVMGTHTALASYFADHRDRVYRLAVTKLGRPLRIAHAWSLSFDASWQPMIGLFDGHAIHLFDAETMRDARGLVAGIAGRGIDMIDTTPSMFAQLSAAGLGEQDCPLAVLALGGEAIGIPLWRQLCALPNTAVFNCYGPTETTVEAVVAAVTDPTAAPTIGTPNTGTAGYVLDSRLRPVPDGVVGELYLAGAQLARGYVGKPGVSADRFVADPRRPGMRMYRTGDLVRRLASGGYGYLGRADDQVKIRGYRIEIGEIETALRALPGVRETAVLVVRRPSGPVLVAFVVGTVATDLRARLADRLPGYMIPHRINAIDALPVTGNGKLDTRRLQDLAVAALASGTAATPTTPTERGLCAAVAELTGASEPGVDADLIALGLDSIAAIALVNALRQRNLAATPRMVLAATTIRELAAAIDAGAGADRVATSDGYGSVGAVPVLSWMYEYGGYRRLALSTLLELPDGIDRPRLAAVLQSLLDGHDLLRARFVATATGYDVITRAPGVIRASDILTEAAAGPDLGATLRNAADRVAAEIDAFSGDLVRAVWVARADAPDLLLLHIHHLAVDPVSWHIVCADLATAWSQLTEVNSASLAPARANSTLPGLAEASSDLPERAEASSALPERAEASSALPERAEASTALLDLAEASSHLPEPAGVSSTAPELIPSAEYTGYRTWAARMRERAHLPEVVSQREHWIRQSAAPDPVLGARRPDPTKDTWASYQVHPVELDSELTAALLTESETRTTLLTALTLALASWRRERGEDPSAGAYLAIEGHGREDEALGPDIDTTRTLGWFTSIYPARFGSDSTVDVAAARENPELAARLREAIAAELASIPNNGLDYGVLRYLDDIRELADAPQPQVLFDYLGRLDLAGAHRPWSPLTDFDLFRHLPTAPEPDFPLRYAMDVIAGVRGGADGPQLVTLLRWSDAMLTAAEVDRIAELWRGALTALAALAPTRA